MPRKPKTEQMGRFGINRKSKNSSLPTSVWGTGRFEETSLDRWWARRKCDGTCVGPGSCDGYRRLSRIRAAYGKRKGRN